MASQQPIVFMGTPGFAVGCLKAMLDSGIDISCVVTAPDRPAGRGRKVSESEVSEFCMNLSVPILKPENLKDPEFVSSIKKINPALIVVVAFRMLPEMVWSIPSIGTINLHASLLPQYRGAAPINHAIINGENKTGVTTFMINHEIDTGSILLRKKVEIKPGETAGTLHDRLMDEGSGILVETVTNILAGKISDPVPQEAFEKEFDHLLPAPKIKSSDCFLDWSLECTSIVNLVRGLSPYPSARTRIESADKSLLLKIIDTDYVIVKANEDPGTISINSDRFRIRASDGYIIPTLIQLEGKRKMTNEEFTRGFRIDSFRATSLQA